jgi:hypothetical protein
MKRKLAKRSQLRIRFLQKIISNSTRHYGHGHSRGACPQQGVGSFGSRRASREHIVYQENSATLNASFASNTK